MVGLRHRDQTCIQPTHLSGPEASRFEAFTSVACMAWRILLPCVMDSPCIQHTMSTLSSQVISSPSLVNPCRSHFPPSLTTPTILRTSKPAPGHQHLRPLPNQCPAPSLLEVPSQQPPSHASRSARKTAQVGAAKCHMCRPEMGLSNAMLLSPSRNHGVGTAVQSCQSGSLQPLLKYEIYGNQSLQSDGDTKILGTKPKRVLSLTSR